MSEVMIDGVLYVPATSSVPNANDIMRGLIMQWEGTTTPENVEDKWEGLRIIVTDDWGRHYKPYDIDQVLADIVEVANKRALEKSK